MTKKLICLGYGYTARALAHRLRAEAWSIAGTARSNEQKAALEQEGIEALKWTKNLDPAAFDGGDAVLISTPPEASRCPAFAASAAALAARASKISWIGYLSSNGVYGDRGGDWVDENSGLYPSTERGRARIAAEAEWAGHAVEWALPLVIFRLPGIYGPGRSAIDAVRAGRAQRIHKKGQVFNRMHVDDIAAALAASIANPGAGDLFNLADDEPAPPQDVVEYACSLLGVQPPPLVPYEEATLSGMARSFYADNKRVRNDRMKTVLAVRLQYPSYREGLRSILAQES
jgi:nucleoside-diphosphate-sugar epimerase